MPLVATTTKIIRKYISKMTAARAVVMGLWQKTKSSGIIGRLSSSVATNKTENNKEKDDEEEKENNVGTVVVGVNDLWMRVTRRMAETKQGIWRRLRKIGSRKI
jgi:hypothetical protein